MMLGTMYILSTTVLSDMEIKLFTKIGIRDPAC